MRASWQLLSALSTWGAGAGHLSVGCRSLAASANPGSGSSDGTEPQKPKSLQSLLQEASFRISQGEVSDLSDIGSQATQLQEQQQQTPQLSAEELMQQQLAMQLRDRQSYPSSGAYDDFVDEPADAATSASQYGSGAANDPARRVVHPRYGYAALGGVTPGDEGRAGAAGLPGSMAAVLGGLAGQHPRVHPSKRFLPGQTYEPQDLNPYAERRSTGRRAVQQVELRPSLQEVLEHADYKNAAFLSRFLSPAGRLLPRRQTKLPLHVHRMVSRQVKLARHMGLMAGEARLDKLHLARVREEEREAAQRRALLAAAGAAGAAGVGAAGRAGGSELLDFGA